MRKRLMMITVLLLISILTANSNTASAKNVPENVDKLVSYFNNLAFSSDMQFVRADSPIYDDPMTVIEGLRGVARITAAITLQNGLSDGSISIENASVELMNLDIPLADLKKFDRKKMDDFVDKLVEMKTKMSNGSEKAEDAFIKLHEIREQWKQMEIKDIPKNLSALDGVKTWNTAKLKTVDIEKVSKMEAEFSSGKRSDYQALETALGALMSEISSLVKSFDTVPAGALLRNLSHLEEFVDITGQLDTNPFDALSKFHRHKKDFEHTAAVLSEIPIDRGDSKILDAISKSQMAIYNKPARFVTTGFTNGFHDLGDLEKDLENPWILRVLDPLYNLNGTMSVTRFKSPTEKFHESWNNLTYHDHYRAVKKILRIQFMFDEVSMQNTSHFGATIASKLEPCKKVFAGTDTTFLKSAVSNIKYIYLKVMAVHNLQKISGNYSHFLKQKQIAEAISYLKENLANFKKDIDWSKTVEEITDEISTNSAQAIIDYTTHLNCLIGLKGPFKEVADASRIFESMRSLNISTELAANFKKVSSATAVSIAKIPEILAAGKVIKEDQSSEVRELERMLLLRNHSRTFGHVSMLLQTVKLATKKNGNIFNTFVTDGEQIAEVSKLKEFQSTRQQISEFIKNAITWKNGIKVDPSSKLNAYGHTLAALSNLNDVDLHTEKLLEIVEKLEETGDATTKKKCENLMMSLRKMSGMELNFSKYSSELKDMPRDMLDMLRIFSTPTNEPPEEIDHKGISIFWITLICAAVVVFVASIYFCCFDWRFPIYKLRQMFKKPVLKTAREGKPPPGGFPNQQKSVGPDGREIRAKRKRKDDSDYELPPPPPPPANAAAKDAPEAPPTKDAGVPEKKDAKQKPSVSTDPPAPKKEETKMVVEKVDETKTPPNAAPASSTQPSTSNADQPPPPPSKTIPKPTPQPSKVPPPPLGVKKATGERTRDSGDVKTRTTQEKTRPTSTKDEESANEEKNKKNKKKVDTLAADTTSSTNLVKTRSADTQKFTVDNRKTLDEVPNPDWDKKFEPPNTSEPPPPLPHKKEKKKKAE